MKNILGLLTLVSLLLSPSFGKGAQTDVPKIISSSILDQLRDSFKRDARTAAAINAVTNNDIGEVTLNRELLKARDREFTHVIRREGVTDQKISGRCWVFAGLNILRYKAEKKLGLKNFELSQNYSFFWHKLELANTFFENVIATANKPHDSREIEWLFKHAIGDGGYWNMVVSNVEKYGVVPKSVMPDTLNAEDTRKMNTLLEILVKKHAIELRKMAAKKKGIKELREYKLKALKEVYRYLSICLTEPPQNFKWRYTKDKAKKPGKYEEYTPLSFYKKYVNIDLKNIVRLFHDPSKPYYTKFRIKWTKSSIDDEGDSFINIPMEVMMNLTKTSVLKNEPVWFGADVGKDRYTKKGILKVGIHNFTDTFGLDFSIPKADRLRSYGSAPNHAMVFTGIDIVKDKPVKWLVENSWGDDAGENSEKGYLIMYSDWFSEYVFATMIDKKFLTKNILKVMDQKPVELKPWDPMWINF